MYDSKLEEKVIPFDNILDEEFKRSMENVEDKGFVILSSKKTNQLDFIWLPRLSLKFRFEGESWISEQYQGYKIAPTQSFACLDGFKHFLLVVKLDGSDKKVIVPQRELLKRKYYDNQLCVNLEKVLEPSLFLFTPNQTTQTIETTNCASSLYLALIFCRLGSLSKNIFFGKDSFQISSEILNRVFKNEPFSRSELSVMKKFFDSNILHRKESAVILKVACLFYKSIETSFLHRENVLVEKTRKLLKKMEKTLEMMASVYFRDKDMICSNCLLTEEEEVIARKHLKIEQKRLEHSTTPL
jgi:hypothetical protein